MLVLTKSCVILISINSEVSAGEGKLNDNIFSHSLTQFLPHPTHTHTHTHTHAFLFPLQILRIFSLNNFLSNKVNVVKSNNTKLLKAVKINM